ncbi:Ypp1p [Lachancea thermotolerans CBS 6340]|uniref:Cargo-transport protein YPP1 n=1 Tax=Lachancea thermotolerans (strain ATCC 56472 / CBS 6340 / NRRL Y-8284) TaxID=559295 RepID=C5DCB4_LACTC|nr:KLTH0B01672p [Lachancea thermotolerans CBS 6340]CAR21425.1 KLTH0B01672p [Lachancea thermotolerans CBS 6340]
MQEDYEQVEAALGSRLLGASEFRTKNKRLNQVLSLQYRVHYHVHQKGIIKEAACKVLLEECNRFERDSSDALVEKVWLNLAGILNYHLSHPQTADKCLAESAKISAAQGAFGTFLSVENLYYSGLLRGDKSRDFYVKHLPEVVTSLPKESNVLTYHYLDRIISRLSMNWSQAISAFPRTVISSFIAIMSEPDGHDQELLALGKTILASAKFPNAEEANNASLEQFHLVLQHYLRSTKSELSPDWHSFVVESMSRTFQSMIVTKTAMIYFGRENQLRESILNFNVFLNYNRSYRDLNNGEWFDVLAIIDAYEHIVSRSEGRDIPKIFALKDVMKRFEGLLCSFYEDSALPLVKVERSIEWASEGTRVFVPERASSLLARSWNALYEYSREDLDKLLNDNHTYYLANALAARPDNSKIAFNYAFTLAQKREITHAVKFLKSNILEREPENYKAWHLLALCESIKEDKNVSFKIVCSVLQALENAVHEDPQAPARDRWQLIHLKLTQLAIIQEMFGVNDALELLPELFELFNFAFPENGKNGDLGSAYNKTKDYLHQSVWLFAVKLYLTQGLIVDAREALAESRNVTKNFQNLNNDLADGYLSLDVDGKKALRSFEKVLFYDALNIDAIVGFAKCLVPTSQENSSHQLQPQTPSAAGLDAFTGEKDRSAAYARLKMVLEEVVERSIEGCHAPEVWWYLSRVYENYDDTERLETSLWNCVKYQELQPIRDFKNCNF